ncbi:related to endochitinase [Fusarium torulosum]|uniref:chitinase n=1 Tax=Fusarium torulosum TaxID=33205 RepID=A0AAE8LYL7_9HYPO|nr:related to endochitinase [Fusarium torulosum]
MFSLKTLSASLVGLLSLSGPSAAASQSGLVASTYFAGFHANRGFPVSSMPWDKYTDAKYAFAETTADGGLDLSRAQPEEFTCFVDAAKKNGVKALISIGGWTGSKYFSTNFGSEKNRTAFVKTCVDFVKKHDLDGIDFDWEYPNRQGLGCNEINNNDTSNFLKFLQELRQDPVGKKLFLTAAGSLFPWNDKTGAASKNLAGFSDVLDYIMIMNYDLYGAWSPTAGPNAPLSRSCDPRNNQGAGDEGVAKWISAGMPASQLVLGVPAYGHGFSVNSTSAYGSNHKLNLYPTQNSTDRFQGSSWDNDPRVDDCGNPSPPGGTYPFWSMITEAKFLDVYGNPAPGISYTWDNCSQTPALYDPKKDIYVSYDNARSFHEKGRFVVSKGLGGFGTYEAGGDFNNILINAIRSAVGLQ